MGIYPSVEFWSPEGRLLTAEEATTRDEFTVIEITPGLKVTSVYRRETVHRDRTDCFCCTCTSEYSHDAACRNHGFAGRRPCDIHDLPGSPYGDEVGPELEGTMPEPVGEFRLRHPEVWGTEQS